MLPFFLGGGGGSFLFIRTTFFAKLPIHTITHTEKEHMFRGLPPPPQWAGSQRSTISGFLSTYVHTICRKSTETDVVTHRGEGACFRGSATPHSNGAGPQRSPIRVQGSRTCTPCCTTNQHFTTTQFHQPRRSNDSRFKNCRVVT